VVLTEYPFVPDGGDKKHHVHTNHFIYHPDAKEHPGGLKASKDRKETACNMQTPDDLKALCNIMGDTSGELQPIFRAPQPEVTDVISETMATAVFDMDARELLVYTANPKDCEPTVKIPFLE